MAKNTQPAACLLTTFAVAWIATGCFPDEPSSAGGGSGGSTTTSATSTTSVGAGGASGGSSTDGGGGSAGGPMIVDASSEAAPPQAGTAVILIDDVFVVQKSVGDAAADASGGGAVDGGDISDAFVVSDGAGATGVSYTFDGDLQGWHYSPYGSTPNIGFIDPGTSTRLKLTDPSVSQLEFDGTNDADGRVDASGALKLTVGFYAANDQIDVQAFTANPNDATQWKVWRGFRATAKVKLVSGGNLNPACPLRMAIYISTGTGYATVLSPPVNLTAGSDWATLTFDFDTLAPGETGLDVTQVNQMGIQANTGVCTPNPG